MWSRSVSAFEPSSVTTAPFTVTRAFEDHLLGLAARSDAGGRKDLL